LFSSIAVDQLREKTYT